MVHLNTKNYIMKKLFIVLMTFGAIIFSACEGDQGPPGPPGVPGTNGGLLVSGAFEISVNFTAANNYEFVEAYGFEVFPSDVTLVYILWETVNGQDIWRLIPQNVVFSNGILTYNYDFTQEDVRFFLDGTVDFGTLDNSYTLNQVFRVVVVPADNVDGVDLTDLNKVIEVSRIQNFEKK